MEDEEEDLSPEGEEEEQDEEASEPEPEEVDGAEASLDEIFAKKSEEGQAAEEEEEESILSLGRDERIETLSVKVVPPDPAKEFTCRKCYLVKHRSQLADKTRMYCRDCA